MISNDKDTGMWQSVYESASKEAEEKDAYVELLSPEQMNGYSQADCLKIGMLPRWMESFWKRMEVKKSSI